MLINEYRTRKADHLVDETILKRWSPRAFDPHFVIDDSVLMQLFEAARWAPSSGNKQPWRFLYAKQGSIAFQTICKHLTGFNNAWVPRASALIMALAEITTPDGDQRDIALLGLGQACQNLVLECLSHDLHAHQFGGFIRDEIMHEFDIDTTRYFLSNIIAIGKLTDDISWMPPAKQSEETPNSRKPIQEFIQEL